MDDEAIERAKEYAAEQGTSVSKLVERFFDALESESNDTDEMSPLVRSLWGTLEGADIEENDYREHLEERYL
jgi:hypothetical protein